MATAVECTHCKVFMTSWSVPGSPVRYYQCPFCARTFCSAYGEVFRSRAGARLVERAEAPEQNLAAEPAGIPMPTADEIRWAGVKARAARWFKRLEQEELPSSTAHEARPPVRVERDARRAQVEAAPRFHLPK